MDPGTTKQAGQLAGTLAQSRTLRGIVTVTILTLLAGGTIMTFGPAAMSSLIASQQVLRRQLQAASSSCQDGLGSAGSTAVAMPSLSRDQIARAHTIWQVARQVGVGDRGAIVGIATAAQESTLGADPATRRLNRDGDVALFQQRAYLGWYAPGLSVEENTRLLSDPVTAARTFFLGHTVTARAHAAARAAGTSPAGPVGYHIPGLVNVAGWQRLPVTVAAQKVQRSAFPTLYAKHEQMAATLVQRFAAEAGTASATEDPAPTSASPGGVNPAQAAMMANPGLCGNGNLDAATCPDSGLPIERSLTPDAVRVLRCVRAQFPDIRSYGGVADRPGGVDDDHQTGRAVDIMIPGRCDPLGRRVRDYLRGLHRQLGIKYLIWCDQIWSVARDTAGWRPYSHPGGSSNDTLAHRDHVHVSVFGNSAGTPVGGSGQVSGTTVAPVQRVALTARFGQCSRLWVACHTGLDFAAPSGTPIRAVTNGTVAETSWHDAYGNLTKINHQDGLATWYAHQSARTVTVGQAVTAGQEIGRVGETGNAFGAHLHLEVRRSGSPIDPATWLRAQGVRL